MVIIFGMGTTFWTVKWPQKLFFFKNLKQCSHRTQICGFFLWFPYNFPCFPWTGRFELQSVARLAREQCQCVSSFPRHWRAAFTMKERRILPSEVRAKRATEFSVKFVSVQSQIQGRGFIIRVDYLTGCLLFGCLLQAVSILARKKDVFCQEKLKQ